jgi:hypothetical protein
VLPNEAVDSGLFSPSRVERADAFVDFRAQRAQLFDMSEQCPSDLFLVLGGRRSTSATACSSVLTITAASQIARRKTQAAET